MERKIFIGIIIVFVVSFSLWYILINYANEIELKKVSQELVVINAKLNNARHAQIDYANIQEKFEKDQERLQKERTRFVGKEELSDVTFRLKKFAQKYNLKLMDFAPELENYFAASPDDKIVALPIEIGVHGAYLDVGKFIENWHTLPFYLIPEEIEIKRENDKSNVLVASVTAALYTWND